MQRALRPQRILPGIDHPLDSVAKMLDVEID